MYFIERLISIVLCIRSVLNQRCYCICNVRCWTGIFSWWRAEQSSLRTQDSASLRPSVASTSASASGTIYFSRTLYAVYEVQYCDSVFIMSMDYVSDCSVSHINVFSPVS